MHIDRVCVNALIDEWPKHRWKCAVREKKVLFLDLDSSASPHAAGISVATSFPLARATNRVH